MHSQHNGSAILHSVLSLSSPTLLHAVFGVKNPLLITAEFYCQYAYIGALFHRLFWHQVAFSVCFFFFLVCAVFLFFLSLLGESVRRSVCTRRGWMWSQLADCSERRVAIEQRGGGGGALPVLGASADAEREKAELEWARASGEWEKRAEENWESLWSPTPQIRGAERGSKWPVLCGWCDTLKSQSHLQHSLHQVHQCLNSRSISFKVRELIWYQRWCDHAGPQSCLLRSLSPLLSSSPRLDLV